MVRCTVGEGVRFFLLLLAGGLAAPGAILYTVCTLSMWSCSDDKMLWPMGQAV